MASLKLLSPAWQLRLLLADRPTGNIYTYRLRDLFQDSIINSTLYFRVYIIDEASLKDHHESPGHLHHDNTIQCCQPSR